MIQEGLNRCRIKGELLHLYRHPNGSVTATIGTGGNKPNVVFLKGFALYLTETYKVGDFILVEGNIQSSYRKEHGIRISIIADRILPLNNTPYKYENHFEVYGTVKSIVNLGDMHKVNINTVSKGFISTVPVTYFHFSPQVNYEVGEPIRVSGIISTTSKEINGEMRYYQNYVANGVL